MGTWLGPPVVHSRAAPSVPYIINGATEWLPFSIWIWEAVEITVANSCCLSARLRSPAPTSESVHTWKRLYGLSKVVAHVVSSCPTFVLYQFMSLENFTSLHETPVFANEDFGVCTHIWLLISSHTLRWKAASVIQRQHSRSSRCELWLKMTVNIVFFFFFLIKTEHHE